MSNPFCPKCKKPKPLLRRKGVFWVCPNNKDHRFRVGQSLKHIDTEKEEVKK
jgi:hypothetical protein